MMVRLCLLLQCSCNEHPNQMFDPLAFAKNILNLHLASPLHLACCNLGCSSALERMWQLGLQVQLP
jgi:hypothetical protein